MRRNIQTLLMALCCAVLPFAAACSTGNGDNNNGQQSDTTLKGDTQNTSMNTGGMQYMSGDTSGDTGAYTTDGRSAMPGGTTARNDERSTSRTGSNINGTNSATGNSSNGDARNGTTDNTSTGRAQNNNTMGNTQEQAGSNDPVQQLEMAVNGGDFDRSFLETIIRHHQQGIEMARLASRNAKRPSVKSFANTMMRNQQEELQRLQQWQQQWYTNVQANR
jgi:hypothetical protein